MPTASGSLGHSHHELGFWDSGLSSPCTLSLGTPAAPGAAASLVTKPHAEPTAQSTSEPEAWGQLPVAAPGPRRPHLGSPEASSAPGGGCPPRPRVCSAPAGLPSAGPQFLGARLRPCWFTPILAEGLGRRAPEVSELRTVELLRRPHSASALEWCFPGKKLSVENPILPGHGLLYRP